jgi:hypothetical protein
VPSNFHEVRKCANLDFGTLCIMYKQTIDFLSTYLSLNRFQLTKKHGQYYTVALVYNNNKKSTVCYSIAFEKLRVTTNHYQQCNAFPNRKYIKTRLYKLV